MLVFLLHSIRLLAFLATDAARLLEFKPGGVNFIHFSLRLPRRRHGRCGNRPRIAVLPRAALNENDFSLHVSPFIGFAAPNAGPSWPSTLLRFRVRARFPSGIAVDRLR